jgi:hypothetical protein
VPAETTDPNHSVASGPLHVYDTGRTPIFVESPVAAPQLPAGSDIRHAP